MGFGIMFIGYFLTLSVEYKGINIPPDIIGYLLMFFACRKLREYSTFFKKASDILIIMSAVSLSLTAMEISPLLGFAIQSVYHDVLTIVRCIFSMIMHYFLLNAIVEISTDVGRIKIAKRCRRNLYITEFMLILQAVSTLPAFKYEGQTYTIISFVIVNLVLLLNCIQIFSCYMWICYEGDEDMDPDNGFDPLAKMVNKSRKEVTEYKKQKADGKKKNKENKGKK